MATTMLSNEEILEAIGHKSVLELADLIEAFKTKFNVSVMAAAPAAGAGAGAAAPADGEPIAAVIRIENSRGRRIGTVTSDYSGRFKADLPPGDYLLSAMTPVDTALPVSRPFGITVRAHHYTEVRLELPATVGSAMGDSPGALPE